ncbi:MAG: V-type ATP synthase subunit D, partial [Spirochaetales bacterium]|nr:V-type ATP synthase subunit D [Spirochaetales bacterium]
LEKIVIPENKETMAWMRGRIEEQERENFILLKVVKDRMEQAEEESRALKSLKSNDRVREEGEHGSSI